MSEQLADSQADLKSYLLILNRRKIVVAATFVILLALALIYSFVKTPVYTATATVLVPEQQASSALNITSQQLQDPTALQRLLVDAQQFAQGDAVKSDAAKALGFKPQVSIGVSTTSDILTFTASSTDPTEAAKIANTYAGSYISGNRANQVAQYTEQITGLETSISQLQAKQAAVPPGSAQYAALQNSITTLSQSVEQTQAASQVVNQVGPSVVNGANTPTSPSSPNKVRNGLLGAVVGLILGIGLAFLKERLDDGLNSREVVERVSNGLPVVGLLPVVDSWKAKNAHHLALVEDPNSNIAEAYRTLRTAVQFMSIEKPHKVIAVTSSIPGEGKSTMAANLAVSFARAGQRTVLVSCDLRRPRVHDFFDMSNDVGLTSVLIGRSSLNDAVVSVNSERRLRVVASGPVPPNPAEILSLNRIVEIVDILAKWADLVILDCPPVLPVSDTLLLSRLVDGILVLASVQQTTTKQLSRTFELLNQIDAPVLGVVLNRVPTDSGSYGYEYGYYRADHYRSVDIGQDARSAVDNDGDIATLAVPERRSGRDRSPLSEREEAASTQVSADGATQPEPSDAYGSESTASGVKEADEQLPSSPTFVPPSPAPPPASTRSEERVAPGIQRHRAADNYEPPLVDDVITAAFGPPFQAPKGPAGGSNPIDFAVTRQSVQDPTPSRSDNPGSSSGSETAEGQWEVSGPLQLTGEAGLPIPNGAPEASTATPPSAPGLNGSSTAKSSFSWLDEDIEGETEGELPQSGGESGWGANDQDSPQAEYRGPASERRPPLHDER